MGGDIVAASSPQGSRFTLTVVLAPAPALPETAPPHATPETNLPGMRLLVVDDQPMVLKAMSVLLQPLGLVTEYAQSGTDALQRLTKEPFDLVLMDVNMADLDGLETTRRLRRSNGPNRDTPVLAVTGAMHEGAAESLPGLRHERLHRQAARAEALLRRPGIGARPRGRLSRFRTR